MRVDAVSRSVLGTLYCLSALLVALPVAAQATAEQGATVSAARAAPQASQATAGQEKDAQQPRAASGKSAPPGPKRAAGNRARPHETNDDAKLAKARSERCRIHPGTCVQAPNLAAKP
jgi:hypothetical protein